MFTLWELLSTSRACNVYELNFPKHMDYQNFNKTVFHWWKREMLKKKNLFFPRLNMTRLPSMSLMACSLRSFTSRIPLMDRTDDTVPPYPFVWRTFRPWHGEPQWKSLSFMYNIIIKFPGRLYVLPRAFSKLS